MSTSTFVEFSGGLDSSLVLSVATSVAREDDLPLPIPVTLRFARHGATDERAFQQLVVSHLGLREWIVFDVDDELDLLSPESCADLAAHGMAASARLPGRSWMLAKIRGEGAILSGEGGDEVFGPAPFEAFHSLLHAVRTRSNRRSAIYAAARLTRRRLSDLDRRFDTEAQAYLTEQGRRVVEQALKDTFSGTGLTMASFQRHHRSKCYIAQMLDQVSEQANRYGLNYGAPFLDIEFMATLARSVPDSHFVNRNYFLQRYFSELLPDELLRRTSKAEFKAAVFGNHSTAFARGWNGSGVPLDLVHPELLRSAWIGATDARTGLLLHRAWMTSEGLA